MDNIVITRAGIIGAAPHRFLDVLAHPKVKEFKFFYFDNEEENFKTLYNLYEKHKDELHGKLVGRKFSWPSFYNRYITSIKSLDELISLIPSAMLRTITAELTKSDILIIGDNDFDSSFGLASICCALGIPYVLTFKETRMRQNDVLERLAIEGAKKIVVPHEGYIDFIRKKHGIDITKKAIFADVDWRGKFVYEKYLKDKNIEKLSEKDGRPHICILSMRTVWDKNESRSPGRYYYLDIIEKLVKEGFVVHLRTKYIIKSLDEPIFTQNNPYFELARKFPKNFFIEPPIDLSEPEGYYELAKYDYGLVTSGAAKDPDFLEFEQHNVPNRYYEYQMARVIPIAPKGNLKYMERNAVDTIFFESPTEILKVNSKNEEIKSVPKKFYLNLIDSIINRSF